jgi:hypothetical protein
MKRKPQNQVCFTTAAPLSNHEFRLRSFIPYGPTNWICLEDAIFRYSGSADTVLGFEHAKSSRPIPVPPDRRLRVHDLPDDLFCSNSCHRCAASTSRRRLRHWHWSSRRAAQKLRRCGSVRGASRGRIQDVWRRSRETDEYTWCRNRNSYWIDHALASTKLLTVTL